ncbi:MAG: DMT family transporter [Burkholderiaceae bacterium]|nr:DMT family transporter [Burkholderiaceae bacterium]
MTAARQQKLGLWLGLAGVVMFAITLPMTRLATGSQADPQLSPWFVTFGRAALAGLLSVVFLLVTRSPLPGREHGPSMAVVVAGSVVGYPLLLAWALRSVDASHAAVVTALLPLATAVVAALLLRQRARPAFWLCALAGSGLVLYFVMLRADHAGTGFGLAWADLLLLGAVLAGALAYVCGARMTPALGAERVTCWVCAMALPFTLPLAIATWPQQPVALSAWAGLAYVGTISMWAGFFAWYRGLALGGALRVSQLQLLQPFFAIVASMLLLGEPLDMLTLGFALAVVATVVAGQRLSRPAAASPLSSVSSPSLRTTP